MRRFLITLLCLSPWLAQAQLESTSDLQRGLVGWWRFNEGTGTNAFDLSGNGNTGALSGSTLPVWTNGVFGGAIQFKGLHSFISTAYTGQLGDFTCCLWFKVSTNQLNADRLIDKKFDTGFWIGAYAGDALHPNKWGSGILDSTSPYGLYVTLTDGVWHHICTIRSSTNQTVYGDGGKVVATGTVSSTALGTTALYIGATSEATPQNGFNGIIDDVRIYNRALSATEVLNLYCQGGGRTP